MDNWRIIECPNCLQDFEGEIGQWDGKIICPLCNQKIYVEYIDRGFSYPSYNFIKYNPDKHDFWVFVDEEFESRKIK